MGNKNTWVLLLLLLTGIVLGGFLGGLADGISWLSWLNSGQVFGLHNPMVLDLGVMVLTFGITIKITMASILGIVIGVIAYRYI